MVCPPFFIPLNLGNFTVSTEVSDFQVKKSILELLIITDHYKKKWLKIENLMSIVKHLLL